jgi:hypothetical protein
VSGPESLIEILGQAAPKLTAGWRLRVRTIDGTETTLALTDATISIGRSDANDIHSEDAQLSRFHARIAKEGAAWVLIDLSSKNGTTANGTAVERHVLQHGDLVVAGETVIVFERGGQDGAEEPAAPSPEQENQLDALLAFGEMVACAEEELAVLEEIAARLRDVVACERSTIILVEENSARPLMHYTHQDTVTGEAQDVSEAVMQGALDADQPAIDTMGGPVPHHILVVPLNGRYRKAGVLVLERGASAKPFPESDLRIASIAASLVTSFLRSVL